VMQVLGRANWWMPAWLDRVVPAFAVEVEVPPPAPAREEASAGVG
jgi:putative drug exporter of the RND superfamily